MKSTRKRRRKPLCLDSVDELKQVMHRSVAWSSAAVLRPPFAAVAPQPPPLNPSPRPVAQIKFQLSEKGFTSKSSGTMGGMKLASALGKQATARTCVVSGFLTELLEIHSEESSLHVLFIPGNPGIVSYYKNFIEAVYELLDGEASIMATGHISHSAKDMACGRMFSLQEQIDHKVDFIRQEFRNSEHQFILVGHSIGSYISIELFKRFPKQVKHVIGLYPFLTLNKSSYKQSLIGLVARSSLLSASISSLVSLLGSLPARTQGVLVRKFLGQSWSGTAVDATCSHLLQYHTMRNVLFMAMTEFKKLSEEPDWAFMKRKQKQISLLFGIDDHWGPLSHCEEVSRQAPDLGLSLEREGHTHAFCCTESGSFWVGRHVATVIKKQVES